MVRFCNLVGVGIAPVSKTTSVKTFSIVCFRALHIQSKTIAIVLRLVLRPNCPEIPFL